MQITFENYHAHVLFAGIVLIHRTFGQYLFIKFFCFAFLRLLGVHARTLETSVPNHLWRDWLAVLPLLLRIGGGPGLLLRGPWPICPSSPQSSF